MKFLSKLKGSLKRGFTVLCATVMVLTSGILTGTEFQASAAQLHGTTYLNEAINKAGGGKYREPQETWQAFLDAQSKTNNYIGTPYNAWLYAASPKGDLWQRNEGYQYKIGASGGTNCTGFVWSISADCTGITGARKQSSGDARPDWRTKHAARHGQSARMNCSKGLLTRSMKCSATATST